MTGRTFAVVLIVALLVVIAAVAMHRHGHGWMGGLGATIHGTRR